MFLLVKLNLLLDLSGTMRFEEIMRTGGFDEKKQLENLQNELQSDDPINIQFTSVSSITEQ